MESAEYRVMYDLETEYWWFRNMHDIIRDLLAPTISDGDKVLDAGCGTGGLMLRLQELTSHVYGLDISSDAARFWHERGVGDETNLASINEIPFASDAFSAVISIDILECDGVYDDQAYRELVRVTKPNGMIITVVPAYQWMMTEGHHKAVHAIRRYNKDSYRALTTGQPIEIQRLTHYYGALFPIIGGVRLLNRLQERFGEVEVKSELEPLSPIVNSTLYHITNVERQLLKVTNIPFGSSLLMVAQKLG